MISVFVREMTLVLTIIPGVKKNALLYIEFSFPPFSLKKIKRSRKGVLRVGDRSLENQVWVIVLLIGIPLTANFLVI